MAVTVFDPAAKLAPLTVSDALPDARVAVPSTVEPIAKVMAPLGTVDPDAGLTLTARTVDAVCAKAAGLAETRVVVAISGFVTVTLVLIEDVLKAALPE